MSGYLPWFFEKIFENFGFGHLRLRGGEVFTFDGFVHFVAVNRDVTRSVYSDLDVSGTDTKNRYFNICSYYQALVFFSRKYQHPC